MKKYLPFILLFFLILGCPNSETSIIPSLSLGNAHDFEGVLVTFVEAFWLEYDPIYVPLENAIGIEVRITNNLSHSVNYSIIFPWGALIDNNGNQIDNVMYFSLVNATTFNGSSILPGATITDTITFDEYSGSPSSFVFMGEPPIYDDYFDNLCYPFELAFMVSEVITRP